ncbi:uncharacterized protein YdhG (YjbR/CyaY superfamily) [Mucilaginibacter yixingensis]|uniref:Uncharacterized protein YdhG (YjbR/CyaY superfamily) n=1 Tax=Mucilaginibacter yixingensis TaxID=1295612 RepID=A0A2T5JB58_9SPHI|nr:DUF1801 domain-containing protein [Mucilaginibacter yixingensis]PTQ98111.1 uncharacterized protein YdhG (YjbR/CyaY superfamily) [Mucilaginibacter yixingensis]
MESSTKHLSADAYILTFPEHIQQKLQAIRKIIHQAAPQAEEVISYNMPAFKQNGILVYFAGYKGHIGFYPTGSGIRDFQHEFGDYKWSKGAVQFPLDEPLPVDLITRMVKYRVVQDAEKAKAKKAK